MSFLGRILEIDLSTGSWEFKPFPSELTWKYLGGRGFNVQYLYAHLPQNCDPLGTDNIIMFSCL